MKKIYLIVACFSCSILFAQTPQAFKYQAVVRNSSGDLIQNQLVAFRVSVLQDGPSGTLVYQERHTSSTNNFGLANLDIGKGIVLFGVFNSIDWTIGLMYIKMEMDPAGGTAYTDMGTNELLSVPYSLQAQTAISITNPEWLKAGNDIYTSNTGKVGIGTSTPAAKLEVEGDLKLQDGVAVTKFSTDATFTENSDSNIPTEKAVKSYLNNYLSSGTWANDFINTVPVPVGATNALGNLENVFVKDNYAYVTSNDPSTNLCKFQIFDISDPNYIIPKGIYSLPDIVNSGTGGVPDLFVKDNFAYVVYHAFGGNDLYIFNISDPDNIVVAGSKEIGAGNSIFVQGNYAYITQPFIDRLRIYDISNPANIIALGYTEFLLMGVNDVYVQGNYAYVVCLGNYTIHIFDISDPNNIVSKTYTYYFTGPPREIFVNSHYAYVAGSGTSSNYLTAFDFGDNNTYLNQVGYITTNLDDPSSVFIKDNYAYVTSYSNNRLCMFDISDPSNIAAMGYTGTYIDHPTSVFANGEYVYVTNSSGLSKYIISGGLMGISPDGNITSVPPSPEFWILNGSNISNANPGSVGIGTNNPLNTLDVGGEVAIGNTYSGTYAAPANGAIVQGNVGIGTTSTKGKLDINTYQGGTLGSAVTSLNHQLVLGGPYNTGPNANGVKLWIGDYSNDGSTVYPLYVEDENNLVDFFLKNRSSESGVPQMYFAGNVGVGTNAPSNSKLQLEGAGTYNTIQRFVNTGTDGADFFMGSNNVNWSMGGNKFVMGHGTPNSTNVDLCIESTGYLGLNLGSSTATQWLDVNGNARFRSVTSGAYSLALNLTSNGTLTTASSDERLKTKIETLNGGLDKVMNLRGVRFNWKEDEKGKQMIGFIAQEVEKVVPELVFTNPVDSYKGVNYAEMTAVLVEAVKEQQKLIEEQRNEFSAKISQLQSEIELLKAKK